MSVTNESAAKATGSSGTASLQAASSSTSAFKAMTTGSYADRIRAANGTSTTSPASASASSSRLPQATSVPSPSTVATGERQSTTTTSPGSIGTAQQRKRRDKENRSQGAPASRSNKRNEARSSALGGRSTRDGALKDSSTSPATAAETREATKPEDGEASRPTDDAGEWQEVTVRTRSMKDKSGRTRHSPVTNTTHKVTSVSKDGSRSSSKKGQQRISQQHEGAIPSSQPPNVTNQPANDATPSSPSLDNSSTTQVESSMADSTRSASHPSHSGTDDVQTLASASGWDSPRSSEDNVHAKHSEGAPAKPVVNVWQIRKEQMSTAAKQQLGSAGKIGGSTAAHGARPIGQDTSRVGGKQTNKASTQASAPVPPPLTNGEAWPDVQQGVAIIQAENQNSKNRVGDGEDSVASVAPSTNGRKEKTKWTPIPKEEMQEALEKAERDRRQKEAQLAGEASNKTKKHPKGDKQTSKNTSRQVSGSATSPAKTAVKRVEGSKKHDVPQIGKDRAPDSSSNRQSAEETKPPVVVPDVAALNIQETQINVTEDSGRDAQEARRETVDSDRQHTETLEHPAVDEIAASNNTEDSPRDAQQYAGQPARFGRPPSFSSAFGAPNLSGVRGGRRGRGGPSLRGNRGGSRFGEHFTHPLSPPRRHHGRPTGGAFEGNANRGGFNVFAPPYASPYTPYSYYPNAYPQYPPYGGFVNSDTYDAQALYDYGAQPPPPLPITQVQGLDVVRTYLLGQLEYYFSVQNLAMDFFLRQQMDSNGWVDVSTIAAFNRIKNLTQETEVVTEVAKLSDMLEVKDNKMRLSNGQYRQWTLPDAKPSSVRDDDAESVTKSPHHHVLASEMNLGMPGAADLSEKTRDRIQEDVLRDVLRNNNSKGAGDGITQLPQSDSKASDSVSDSSSDRIDIILEAK